jgi:hypothetical protein
MQPASGVPSAPSMTDNFRLRQSVFHAVQVLEKAKSAFPSKDLAGLRKYLEGCYKRQPKHLRILKLQPITPSNNPLQRIEVGHTDSLW